AKAATGIMRRPGQLGAVAVAGGKPVVCDWVGRADAFAALHGPLVRGYALDAVETLAGATLTIARVEQWLALLRRTHTTERPSSGAGSALHFVSAMVEGTALAHDGELLQLCGFPGHRREARAIGRLGEDEPHGARRPHPHSTPWKAPVRSATRSNHGAGQLHRLLPRRASPFDELMEAPDAVNEAYRRHADACSAAADDLLAAIRPVLEELFAAAEREEQRRRASSGRTVRMATIPRTLLADDGTSPGELKVFAALRDQLDDDWDAFHSIGIVHREGGGHGTRRSTSS
ncbi:MAG: ARPP-1 family domain-containing protein, partial [Solirubrobacteraceae bacterium]